MGDDVLEVRGLGVEIAAPGGARAILSDISFRIARASITGLFGESGSGKTTLALALLGLLGRRYRVHGSIRLAGRELAGLRERQWEAVRGAGIAMVPQDPLLALNPVLRVERQIAEVRRAHGWPAATEAVDQLLEMAGLEAARVRRAYPHQLSGGERQRVAIAQALACGPALVVADEPFTALDTTLAASLAELFREMRERTGTSFLLVSHSPGVLARTAGQVLVMDRGRIVEAGDPRTVLARPEHAYTAGLLRDVPRLPRFRGEGHAG